MAKENPPYVMLKNGREASLLRGHPWIFSGAVARVSGNAAAGDVVTVTDAKGQALALAFYHPATDIALRVLSADVSRPVNEAFWRERVGAALDLRRRLLSDQTTAWRWINAEGDGCPGLIVDAYGDTLVLSVTTAGMEKHKGAVVQALVDLAGPSRIYEQSAGRSRKLEGLEEARGYIVGKAPDGPVRVFENGHAFDVDIEGGQKTGFFLDQRKNRETLGALASGATVLNCFCYTGAFSVYCVAGGAARVVSVDISQSACEATARHLRQNGFDPDRHPVVAADAFVYLRHLPESFDLMILDPPAFAKTRKDVTRASRGYKDINLQAMKQLPSGGLLATFSCSNFIEEDLFGKIVGAAASDAKVRIQVLARLEAGPDHPTGLGHPEGRYLKGLLLRKL